MNMRDIPSAEAHGRSSDRRCRPPSASLALAAAALTLLLAGLLRAQPAADPAPDAPQAPAQEPDQDPSVSPEPAVARPGDEVLVVFADGREFEGVLIADEPGRLVVSIAGLDVRLRPADISVIVPLPPLRERFRQMRAVIRSENAVAILALAEWAKDRGLFAESLAEIDRVLSLEPRNAQALRLRMVVERLAELDEAGRGGQDPADRDDNTSERAHDDDAPPGANRPRRPERFPLLSAEQVNLMKVFEVDLADPPRLIIPRETVQELLTRYAGSPLIPSSREGKRAFLARPPAEILEIMFRLQARELYGQVRVLGHPESMRTFRDWVHGGWLLNACASTRCHGGVDAGRLLLNNRRRHDERTLYTNFLILDRFHLSNGEPLLDYAEPDRSLLLQMTLPAQDAFMPHPDVPGWRPVFAEGSASRGWKRTVQWLNSMYRPRPNYPITYEPPGETPSPDDQPETTPGTPTPGGPGTPGSPGSPGTARTPENRDTPGDDPPDRGRPER